MKMIFRLIMLVGILQLKSNQLEVVVANEAENILTLGIENPLRALIEKTSAKNVILKTDNGRITNEGGAIFGIIPAHVGMAQVQVCRLVKHDTIVVGTEDFRVHSLPEPVARIGGFFGGPIKKASVLAQGGLIAHVECCGFDFPVQIVEFTLIGIRDNNTVGICKNIGNRYNEKAVILLNQLANGDKLIVCRLVVKATAQENIIHPLEFTIEE